MAIELYLIALQVQTVSYKDVGALLNWPQLESGSKRKSFHALSKPKTKTELYGH